MVFLCMHTNPNRLDTTAHGLTWFGLAPLRFIFALFSSSPFNLNVIAADFQEMSTLNPEFRAFH